MLAPELFFISLWPCLSTFSPVAAIIVSWFFAKSDQFSNLSEQEIHRSACSLAESVGLCYPSGLRKAGSLPAAKWFHTLWVERMKAFSFGSIRQNPVLKLIHLTALFMCCGVAEMMVLQRGRLQKAGKKVLVPGKSWCPRSHINHAVTVVYVEATKLILACLACPP